MDKRKITGSELARATGIHQVKFSRWHIGKQTFADIADIKSVAVALNLSDSETSELLIGKLRDDLGELEHLVKLENPNAGPPAESGYLTLSEEFKTYPPQLKKIFDVFSNHWPSDPELRSILEDIFSLYGYKISCGAKGQATS